MKFEPELIQIMDSEGTILAKILLSEEKPIINGSISMVAEVVYRVSELPQIKECNGTR